MLTQEQAQEIVRNILTKSQTRFKQELIGENEEMLDRVLRQYRAKVARHSWKLSQKWSKWETEGPVLMPDYARIYYRKGRTEVLLQEFPPQVRLMKFRGALVHRTDSQSHVSEDDSRKIHHFSLALPYVVFIFKFFDGVFQEVKCAFCDRPLKRLEERPLKPYLSNIDNTLQVCLGHSLDKSQLIKGQLTQQIALILSNFWQTAYSEDWSGNYWGNKAHFTGLGDHRMTTLQNWQDASQENSLFVVEDVNWQQASEESFGDLIVKMLQDDPDNKKLHDDLYDGLVDSFFEEIKKSVQENTGTVADKLSNQQIDELVQELLTKANA